MAPERLLMRHIREILRLKWTLRRSHRETARSLGISAGAVASVVTRAKAMALTWDAVGTLSDDALERTLYGPKLAPPAGCHVADAASADRRYVRMRATPSWPWQLAPGSAAMKSSAFSVPAEWARSIGRTIRDSIALSPSRSPTNSSANGLPVKRGASRN